MMQRLRDDRGVALVMVIVLGFISVLLLGTALTAASSGLRQAVTSQRSTSALDAAFAGVQDYLARVNTDDSYVKYGNALSPFTITSGSATSVAAPAVLNPAMGAGGTTLSSLPGSTKWPGATVPGSGGAATFRYEVDNHTYKTTGVIQLRVTGSSGDRTRTLLVSLRVRGFVDYSYFTDLEMQDPIVSGDPDSCAVRAPRPTATCKAAPVMFYKDDAISGDVHSNDLMMICQATFTGRVTTYYSGNPLWSVANCPSGTATMSMTNISHADELPLPSTNTTMEQDAGCVYAGPTQVTYNADGTMTVISPWTLATTDATRCGSVAQLRSPTGATVNQLDHDALYVKTVPSDSSDPNYWGTGKPANLLCIDVDGNTTTATNGVGWQLKSGGVTVRYPLSNEVPATIKAFTDNPKWDTTRPAYGCQKGDLYLRGTVTTQTTASSDNYVYVIDDVVYGDKNADVLGVVGQNGVTVWNPMKAYAADADNPYRPILTGTNREIDAAILSVKHTFGVQNFDRGTDRGLLKIFGSIGQKFRGVVATKGDYETGYDKSYQYDTLLKTVSPPKFLAAGSTIFTVSYYAAVASAFRADGSVP